MPQFAKAACLATTPACKIRAAPKLVTRPNALQVTRIVVHQLSPHHTLLTRSASLHGKGAV